MTVHRAKGLEFDHVVIVDSGGWAEASDDERRLFYVAMTRARRTLTICASGSRHAFASELAGLALGMRPEVPAAVAGLESQTWRATPEHVTLSWPGSFAEDDEVNRAIAALEVGDELSLRERKDKKGWELVSSGGCVVGRMSSKFRIPPGQVVQTRVHAVIARSARPEELRRVLVETWEVVLPEIEYMKRS